MSGLAFGLSVRFRSIATQTPNSATTGVPECKRAESVNGGDPVRGEEAV